MNRITTQRRDTGCRCKCDTRTCTSISLGNTTAVTTEDAGENDEIYSVENPEASGILERVQSALREGGVGDEEIAAYTREATSRCYNHLLFTTMTWVCLHWDGPGLRS